VRKFIVNIANGIVKSWKAAISAVVRKRLGYFQRHKISAKLYKVFRFLLLTGLSFILLYPILYMISIAFRPTNELFDPMVIWIPKTFTMENVRDALKLMDYAKSFVSTVKIGVVSTLLQIVSCSLVGYGLSRFSFFGKKTILVLVIFTIIVPPQAIIIPLYLKYRNFTFFGIGNILGLLRGQPLSVNILNTLWAFYVPALLGMGIRSGLFIFIFTQFFRGMPRDLEDAAYIDGCGAMITFLRIIVPNTGVGFLTVFLFSNVWYWNDYFYSSIFYNKVAPLSVKLVGLRQEINTQLFNRWSNPFAAITRVQAGSLLTILPILVLYIFLQRYFTESIERTGIVG
jgi:multiple sugar transport system permease protein